MSVRVRQSAVQRAESLVNENYERQREGVLRSVRARLFARGVRLDGAELEEAYNAAWHSVFQILARGGLIRNLPGLLVDITSKRAIDIYRKHARAMHSEMEVERLAVEPSLEELIDDQRRLERLLRRLQTDLTELQRNATSLCLLQGYTRREAAELLGVEPRLFEKVMDRLSRRVAAIAATIDSRGCGDNEWSRALRSYALGGLSAGDRERVSSHIQECASCRRYVTVLRGLAVLTLPLRSICKLARDIAGQAQKMLAPHGAGVQATDAGTGGLASQAAGGAGWTASVAGAGKVAAVVGATAIGMLSLHTLTAHHAPRDHPRQHTTVSVPGSRLAYPPLPAQEAPVRQLASGSPDGQGRPVGETQTQRSAEAASTQVVREFGFEQQPTGRPAAQPARPAAVAADAHHPAAVQYEDAERVSASKSREFGGPGEAGPSARSESGSESAASASGDGRAREPASLGGEAREFSFEGGS